MRGWIGRIVLAASLVACSSSSGGNGPGPSGAADASTDVTGAVDGGGLDATSTPGTQTVGTAGGTVVASGISFPKWSRSVPWRLRL